MSYCVNCGVELAPSEHACPLCGTEVRNPREPYDKKYPKPFPSQLDIFAPTDDKPLIAAIISIVLALPAAICLACDIAYTKGAGWSVLVIGAMAALWVFIVPALFVRRHRILKLGILDTGALLGYLWVIERFATHGLWVKQLALPLVILADVLFIIDYFIITKLIFTKLKKVAFAVATVPVMLIGIEICLDLYLDGAVSLLWSYLVSIPCLIFALLLVVIDRRQRLKEEMRKRLHM